MYIPHYYKNEDLEEVKEFIKQNSFAILVNQLDGKPWASHIPLELSPDDKGGSKLVGHIAKANPQWKSFDSGSKVLAIFNGPHSYVSSSWYRDEEVPTWNYIAVHVYGEIAIQDQEALYKSLDALVNKYEKDSNDPIALDNLSKKTMRQIRGVVGFEISISEIHAAYKLSQGRPEDHPRIIDELEQRKAGGASEIAGEMRKRLKKGSGKQ